MKAIVKTKALPFLLTILTSAYAYGEDVPSESNAKEYYLQQIQVYKDIYGAAVNNKEIELADLKKTNGKKTTNGRYQVDADVTYLCLKDYIFGIDARGENETCMTGRQFVRKRHIDFAKTEKGWEGIGIYQPYDP